MDFTKTLALLLDLVGEEVNVTVADRESVFVNGEFSGVLRKGQELLKGKFEGVEVVSFQVNCGSYAARFTLTSSDFSDAFLDTNRVTIWEGGVEFSIEPVSLSSPLKEPRAFDDGLQSS